MHPGPAALPAQPVSAVGSVSAVSTDKVEAVKITGLGEVWRINAHKIVTALESLLIEGRFM